MPESRHLHDHQDEELQTLKAYKSSLVAMYPHEGSTSCFDLHSIFTMAVVTGTSCARTGASQSPTSTTISMPLPTQPSSCQVLQLLQACPAVPSALVG